MLNLISRSDNLIWLFSSVQKIYLGSNNRTICTFYVWVVIIIIIEFYWKYYNAIEGAEHLWSFWFYWLDCLSILCSIILVNEKCVWNRMAFQSSKIGSNTTCLKKGWLGIWLLLTGWLNLCYMYCKRLSSHDNSKKYKNNPFFHETNKFFFQFFVIWSYIVNNATTSDGNS